MTLIFELDPHIEWLCRDLSAGRLKRDPLARIILGTTEEEKRRERLAQAERLGREAKDRRLAWLRQVAEMQATQARLQARGGLSARESKKVANVNRGGTEWLRKNLQLVEPAPVHLPGWGRAA